MNQKQLKTMLTCAQTAACQAGDMMRKNLNVDKTATHVMQHDIKLDLDVRCQKRIETTLRRTYPEISVLGEEGISGDPQNSLRWVVDPIDGTVNFAYGMPHACVSIALQGLVRQDHQTLLGVVHDPFLGETWTAIRGQAAKLNGRKISASSRAKLAQAIVAIGFGQNKATLDGMLPAFSHLAHRVRKIRILGSAALSLSWVAAGRMDAFMENSIFLWDIAAGGLILECAGGDFYHKPIEGEYRFKVIGSNGRLPKQLRRVV
jgi:myo-inositol-1(or 4)-monophosphatase